MNEQFATLDLEELLRVAGGGPQDDNGFGRIGPGLRWRWLGDYYSPEARRHDAAVRDGIAAGRSPLMAHLRALPSLPAAAASYPRARWFPGPNDHYVPREQSGH